MSLDIPQHPLAYVQGLARRCTEEIDLVVIHCTELPDLATARTWGERVVYPESQTGNSGHFYIDRDGAIEEWVPIEYIAHHVRRLNDRSIGIELVNNGRYPHWFHSNKQQMAETYPDVQIKALEGLLNHLYEALPSLAGISGHEDLDTRVRPSDDRSDVMIKRKLDPGPHFPWRSLLDNIALKRLTADEL